MMGNHGWVLAVEMTETGGANVLFPVKKDDEIREAYMNLAKKMMNSGLSPNLRIYIPGEPSDTFTDPNQSTIYEHLDEIHDHISG